MRAIALILVTAGGCFVQTAAGVRAHGAAVRGGEVTSAAGGDAVRVIGSLAMYGADPGLHVTGELDAALAVSPIGWLRGERADAPWVDVGGVAGYGGGVNRGGGFLSGSFGGWADVRLGANSLSFPSLHLTVVRELYTAHADDATVFTIDLGWTFRDPTFNFHIDG
jgi:hypothetical protein